MIQKLLRIVKVVNNDSDRAMLLSNLHKSLERFDKGQMPFSGLKCKVMHLGRNNTRFQVIGEVSEENISDYILPELHKFLVRPHLE